MANKLDPMDLKQIISLHIDGFSNRRIGSTLGISRNTVNSYMKFFKGSGYSFEELLNFDTQRFEALFPSHTTVDTDRLNELMLYFEGVNKARNIRASPFSFIIRNMPSRSPTPTATPNSWSTTVGSIQSKRAP